MSVISFIKGKITSRLRAIRKYYRYKYHFPKYYQQYAAEPVNPRKVLLLEMRFTKLSNSFEYLRRCLEESGDFDIVCSFVQFNFIRGKEFTARCEEMIRELATAKYVITDEASLILSCLPLREETKAINLWHACGAFKKWGRSTSEKLFGSTAAQLDKYPNYGNLDLVTVSSPEVIWAYEEAMNLPAGIVAPIGISRTDLFYQEDFVKSRREKIYELVPQARDKKIILYAPTFRGHVSSAEAPDEIDFIRFKEELSDQYVLICKHHPFCKELVPIPEEASDFAVDLTKKASIEDLLCCADICISDYSSLVFEYSLFEKPMIFYAYDYEEYCDWRGFYYEYEDFTPGPIVRTQDELLDAIRQTENGFDKSEILAFKKRFMESCDGHATERIMQWMKDHA